MKSGAENIKTADEPVAAKTEVLGADNASDGETSLQPNTYWFTRIVLLRFLAFIYFVAFLVALLQNKALIGHDGILPADRFMSR